MSPRDVTTDSAMESRGFVTIPAICKKTGHRHSTVLRWIQRGAIDAERVAGRWYVKMTSLVGFLGLDFALHTKLIQPKKKRDR